jgi:adenosine deaminase
MDVELIRRLPKNDLHVHLDGSLRIETLIELAHERGVALPAETEDGLRELVFRERYEHLGEYLEGFRYTVAVLTDADALERVAYELCVDNFDEGVRYVEVRFAPQLHVRSGFEIPDVVGAVDRGLRRAIAELNLHPAIASGQEPRFGAGIILTALRFFTPEFAEGYRRYFEVLPDAPVEEVYAAASLALARVAVRLKREGMLVVAFDLAGREHGYPASDHSDAFQVAHEGFLGKTVHAGEDYGPESIFQAISDCHTDRIGHGTWLFDASRVHGPEVDDPGRYVEELAQFVADKRITIEVCLTSNQQTVPELADDLSLHPFGEMSRRRLSTTFCTDNRLVSNTTVTEEIARAVDAFDLSPRAVRDCLIYGFKRSFFPGTYFEKRAYVRQVIDFADRVLREAGVHEAEKPGAGP